MPRSSRIVVAVAVPLGAAAGLVGNWVTADLPDWLADPVVRWLLLGVLVLAAVVVALLAERSPATGLAEKPRFNAPTGSLTPPAPDHVALRGRERETKRLRELVARPRGRFAVIAGAGGMGKTALARTVADAARRDGRVALWVRWVRWRTLEQLTGQMLEAATLLGLPEARIGVAQQSGQSLPDLVWGHLERTGRWVIVVDNLDEPADAAPAGEQLREYRSWIRPTGAGLLVVTSRDRDPHTWGPSAELFPLDPLDAATGAQVLRDAAPSAGEGAEDLATRLGGLPLALHAAATAIGAPASRVPTFAAYSAALAEMLLPERPDTADPDVVRRLVGHTWELSLDQLAAQGHAVARPLLRLLALFAEAPIPRSLITPDLFPDGPVTAAAVDGALAGLHRYGLVEAPNPDTTGGVTTVVLHPVVRAANADLLKAATDLGPWVAATENALIALVDELSEAGRSGWETARLLAPHVLPLTGLHSPDEAGFLRSRDALDQLADLVGNSGARRLVVPLREAVLAAEVDRLGPDHRDTLVSRGNLANALVDIGDFEAAAELYQHILEDYERIAGPDGLDTLAIRNNLASTLGDLGRYEESADLHERTLDDYERVLGPDHPDTIASRNNLAGALRDLGRHEEAIELQERVVADRERVLGPDDPDTLASRINLATAIVDLGRHGEAVEIHRRTLIDFEHLLGPDHPDILSSRDNLAIALSGLGRYQEAADLHRQVLADRERVLGPDHPATAVSKEQVEAAQRALAAHRRRRWWRLGR